jgi:acetyl-CoA synthetase
VTVQLACARIGAVHSVVFAGFSADSLSGRILDSKPRVLLTTSAVNRGAKPINLKVWPPSPIYPLGLPPPPP